MNGIQTPYVYVGTIGSSFPFHLEDGDLASLNYHHSGKPKLWYVVPGDEGKKLERLVAECTSDEKCELPIRHKQIMIPPSTLRKHNIKFARVSIKLHKIGKKYRVFDNKEEKEIISDYI